MIFTLIISAVSEGLTGNKIAWLPNNITGFLEAAISFTAWSMSLERGFGTSIGSGVRSWTANASANCQEMYANTKVSTQYLKIYFDSKI